MARRPDTPCTAGCGRLLWSSKTSAPPELRVCRQCRWKARAEGHVYAYRPRVDARAPLECWWCGCEFNGDRPSRKFCSLRCVSAANSVNRRGSKSERELEHNRRRRAFDQSAPGLNWHQRLKLLSHWVRQGRICTYCGEDNPTQVDHVIPLSRGGTNYEGNLVPACASCNNRKGSRFVAEWVHAA